MNISEQKKQAKAFIKRWEARGNERQDSQPFWLDLLRSVYGIENPETYISFEDKVMLDHTSFIDGFIDKTKVLIEQKGADKDLSKAITQSDGSKLTPFQQAKRYSANLPYSSRPRWIVTSNFKEFYIYDMEQPNSEAIIVKLADLETEYYRLEFLVEKSNLHIEREMHISMQAGEIVGKIYEALLAQYVSPDNEDSLKSINQLCVRLVFCLYAEDAGIFGKHGMFHDYLVDFEARFFRKALMELFEVLNTPIDQRDPYLDEPSSDLDLDSLLWLEAFIHETDKTVIFISHDEALLSHTATAILQLELLKKRQQARASYFQGSYEDYKTYRKDSFDRQLQVAQKEREEHAKKMARHHRIHQSVEHTVRNTHDATAGRLIAKKMKNVLSQEKRYAKEADNFTEIPQDMDAISLFFSDIKPLPANKVLLRWENRHLSTGQIVDFEIRGQDKLVITGQNGIGKTRLLKDILSELTAKSDLSVGYMPQNYEELLKADQTSLSFLAEIVTEEKARNLLASLQFTREEAIHSVCDLSGGQKAKLFLAKMVLAGNTVLVLDEPTRHFSPTSQPVIRQLLANFSGCLIAVSHDRLFIEEIPQKRYELDRNKLRQTH